MANMSNAVYASILFTIGLLVFWGYFSANVANPFTGYFNPHVDDVIGPTLFWLLVSVVFVICGIWVASKK